MKNRGLLKEGDQIILNVRKENFNIGSIGIIKVVFDYPDIQMNRYKVDFGGVLIKVRHKEIKLKKVCLFEIKGLYLY
jgi:hypothetical protein